MITLVGWCHSGYFMKTLINSELAICRKSREHFKIKTSRQYISQV
uniref:Uncharacterized protein n=1 Tax=Ciona intestinalis TaxID=7719 RepID=H2XSZ3_CIOIN